MRDRKKAVLIYKGGFSLSGITSGIVFAMVLRDIRRK